MEEENKGEIVTEKVEKKMEENSEEELIKKRKEKVLNFIKIKYNYLAYVGLAIIIYIALKIRSSNLAGLKDITTGTWTLGPDLDPFLFLRWAKYIVANGHLMTFDAMRYVPLGYDTSGELIGTPYLIAWFHKLATFLGSQSLTQSAVLYPVFMFGLTIIAFFLMVRKLFADELGEKYANVVALVASLFLSVIPALLPRTIAGIPEKEAGAFLFMFLSFYFFICAWKSKSKISRPIYSILAGIATGAMALIWGGFTFVFLTIGPAVLIAFIMGKVGKKEWIIYGLWILGAFATMHPFSTRYGLSDLFASIDTGFAVAVFFIIGVHFVLYGTALKNYLKGKKLNIIPPQVISAIISIVILVAAISILLGPSWIPSKITAIVNTLITPATSRLILTVAENRQPYFSEWAGSFGPMLRNIPVTFWLMFFGSIYLFHKSIRSLGKNRRALTLSYVFFLIALIFSRYSPDSTLNGVNWQSTFLYAAGFVVFVVAIGYYKYKYYSKGEDEKLKEIDFGFILIFTLFFLSIVAARATVRTIMVLVPAAAVIVGYFTVVVYVDAKKVKDKNFRLFAFAIVGLILLLSAFSAYQFYKESSGTAVGYVPSVYTQQWQKAMAWTRENTSTNAVFGHWWDYGYWLQSIGERATVLDGGNAISYWNYMMGRYALTGTNETEALDFLYAHNTTHFLIDSTDIGKYSAFSSIGSDVNYDRASFIPTLLRDTSQVQEKKNSTVFVYTSGGIGLDEDITYMQNGTRIFLPSGQAGLAGVLIEKNSSGAIISNPQGIFVYRGQQYSIPFRYLFDGKFRDFGEGIESGVFLFSRLDQTAQGVGIEKDGAMIYLSKRTVKSQLARLYLYNDNDPHFKLVHSEDDFIVAQIKSQNPGFADDFVYYGGIRGPIRIWEIDYPGDIELNKKYLDTNYPRELLYAK
jgi:asparagine N-glycosylation enzyme membrane subunit Stt3